MSEDNRIPVRVLTSKEKLYVKSRLLEVTSIIKKWKKKINFKLSKKLKVFEVRKAILNGSFEKEFPEIVEDKKKLISFSNDHDNLLDGPVEYVIVCSFALACMKIAKARSRTVAAELNLNPDSVLDDLLQEAYGRVLYSMYYFTKKKTQLSTLIIGCVKRHIERCCRYKYCKSSPMSSKDCIGSYKIRTLLTNNPGYTLEEVASELEITAVRAKEILGYMAPIVRTSYDLPCPISSIPDKSSSIEDADNIDTFQFLKGLFDSIDEGILSLTKEEKDVITAAISNNFERGWQSNFAKQYINQSTSKPYSRARIGQIYSSAIKKIRAFKKVA